MVNITCCPSFKDSLNLKSTEGNGQDPSMEVPGLDARRKQPPRVLLPTELAYIAGVIDGEGTIGIYRLRSTGYQMKVCISNCSRPLLVWIRERVGGALVRVAKETPRKRESWQLVVSQYQAAPLLLDCRDYLQVKRPQADLAVRYMEEYKPASGTSPTEQQVARRRWYWDETRRLNRRGPP